MDADPPLNVVSFPALGEAPLFSVLFCSLIVLSVFVGRVRDSLLDSGPWKTFSCPAGQQILPWEKED